MGRARAACVGQRALVDRELLLEDRAQVLHCRALPERESPSPLYPSGGETAIGSAGDRSERRRQVTIPHDSADGLIRLGRTSERSSSSNAVSRAPLPSGATASGLGGSTIRNCFCDRPAPVDAGRRAPAWRRRGAKGRVGGREDGRAGGRTGGREDGRAGGRTGGRAGGRTCENRERTRFSSWSSAPCTCWRYGQPMRATQRNAARAEAERKMRRPSVGRAGQCRAVGRANGNGLRGGGPASPRRHSFRSRVH